MSSLEYVSVHVEFLDAAIKLLEHMKVTQKYLPCSEGARAFAMAVTKLEESIMWLGKVGCHGYTLENE